LGVEVEDRELSTYEFLVEGAPLEKVAMETEISGLSIVPATIDLSSADIDLISNEKRSHLLHEALRKKQENKKKYDFILIDCPPSLNILTVNAMVASHSVLIPLQSEFFALEGLSQLLLTVKEVRQTANENLRVEGIVLTMFDGRNNLSKQVEADARSNLKELVFETIIPRNVRVSEAPSYSMPVLTYDPSSKGSKAYMDLAKELLANNS
jgi:chromosome partitioning protein